ncbi:LAMI_0G04434g1_1 [Lachancea mirantina]|uniref:LAMI_0G04434g1_1 n=1 Tax=Lachancea mirantina TaxID=1230905 RepID=A0A1G4K8G6_9SACH|nr:LAMI_0G04434g1_1 [Lachancea mirantina]
MSSAKPKLNVVRAPVLPEQTTPEQRYWRSYGATQLVKEHNSVTSIEFNPAQPHDFAIASSTRVQLFSSRTRQVIKTFSRFKDVVYSASFREDGKLLAMGDATGMVTVYDSYNPRTLLLSVAASSHPTHVAKFHPGDVRTLVSASDDRIVRVWDITQSYEPQVELTGATDYVRSVCFIPQAPHLVVTGSYDGLVRLHDTRTKNTATVLTHGLPVEDIKAVSPTQLVSCGGSQFKVWDLTSQRTLVERGNFAKTVTSLDHVDMGDSAPMRSALLTSSLDGHVKVFDCLDGYKVKFGWKFSAPVLSCALSPGDAQGNKHMVAGLSSGLLAIRTKKKNTQSPKIDVQQHKTKGSNFQRMMRGSEYAGDQEHIIHNDKARPQRKLRAFERHINQFRWAEALDSAFVPGTAKELTLTALHELRKRGKIRVALYGRDEASLEPLLNWCHKGIEDVRSANVVADWIAVVLELYSDLIAKSPVLEEMVVALRDKVKQEVHRGEEAQRIEGMLHLLVN